MPLLQQLILTNVLPKLLQTHSKIHILSTGTNFVLLLAIVEARLSKFRVRQIGVLGSWVRLPPPPPIQEIALRDILIRSEIGYSFQTDDKLK